MIVERPVFISLVIFARALILSYFRYVLWKRSSRPERSRKGNEDNIRAENKDLG